MFQSQSAAAFWLFVKPPLLDTIQLQGKTLRKTNTLWSAARKEDFFSANPSGHGLGGKGIVQKFATQNAYRYFIVIRTRKQIKKGQVKSNIRWQFPELRIKYLLKFASHNQDDYFGH